MKPAGAGTVVVPETVVVVVAVDMTVCVVVPVVVLVSVSRVSEIRLNSHDNISN